ncbi:uncharacterized protein LOC135467810 [Liolophura sinensis]|uniref:uncharacterized protein LOC135467810 n=1 Tax=Liolophura sinensis TaxID=3198878 RepID=UPI0031595531
MMFFRATIFLWWTCMIVLVVSQEPCLRNGTCSCSVVGNMTDMFCQLTVPFPEIQADGVAIRTLTLSAGRNVTRAETNFNSLQVQRLVITGSFISELDCFTLDGMDGLESISIEHTYVSRVPTCFLRQFVTSLNLVDSHMTSLSRRAFAVSPNLKHLNLSGNCLSHLRPDTFMDLHNLESLDLSDNCLLGELTSSIFLGVTKLKVLRLERNYISSIRGKFWRNLTNLEHLNLSENNITGLFDLSFHPQYTIVLSVSSNNIKKIENLLVRFVGRADETSNFTLHLDVSKNKLKQFPVINIKGPRRCQLLFGLNVDNNEIAKFARDPVLSSACEKRIKLRVSLTNNHITNFPPCHSYILQKFHFLLLNLSGNFIDGNLNTLCGASEVETLDISKNMLNGIGRISAANGRSRLQRLLLAENKIEEVRGTNVGEIFPNLKLIDLSNNSISSVDGSFAEMPDSLESLKLAGNPLMCNLTEIELTDLDTRCHLQNIMDYARCISPLNLQGYQVKCVLAENCSTLLHTEICANDTYLEIDLSVHTSAYSSLHAVWHLTGPGDKYVEELLLELTKVPDDQNIKTVHIHTLTHEFTFTSLQPNMSYWVCLRAATSGWGEDYQACVTAKPKRSRESENDDFDFNKLSVVLGVLLGMILASIVAFLIFHFVVRRRGFCQQENEYNGSSSIIERYVEPTSIHRTVCEGNNDVKYVSTDRAVHLLTGDNGTPTEFPADNENATDEIYDDLSIPPVPQPKPTQAQNLTIEFPADNENATDEIPEIYDDMCKPPVPQRKPGQAQNLTTEFPADNENATDEIPEIYDDMCKPPVPQRKPGQAQNLTTEFPADNENATDEIPEIYDDLSIPPVLPRKPRQAQNLTTEFPADNENATDEIPEIYDDMCKPPVPPRKPRQAQNLSLWHSILPDRRKESVLLQHTMGDNERNTGNNHASGQAEPQRGSSQNIRFETEAIAPESEDPPYEPVESPGRIALFSDTSSKFSDIRDISNKDISEETEPKVIAGRRDSAYDSFREEVHCLQGEIPNPVCMATNSVVEGVDDELDQDEENDVLLVHDNTESEVDANESSQQTITNPNYRYT